MAGQYDPVLQALQKLQSGYGSYGSPDKLNNAEFQVGDAMTDANFDVDQQIKDTQALLDTLKQGDRQANRDQIQQLEQKLKELKQQKDALEQTSRDTFYSYRPAGWNANGGPS